MILDLDKKQFSFYDFMIIFLIGICIFIGKGYHNKEGITKATISENATINAEVEGDLNRDIKNTSTITKDESDQIDMNLSIDLDMIRNPGKYWEAMKNLPKNSLDVAGKINALPGTILGLGAGMTGYAIDHVFGDGKATYTFGHNAIQFENNPMASNAFTLGNTINYPDHYGPKTPIETYGQSGIIVGYHEEAHTYQQQRLGILFLLSYPFMGFQSSTNSYEQGANAYAIQHQPK